jgi:hypothetical protein
MGQTEKPGHGMVNYQVTRRDPFDLFKITGRVRLTPDMFEGKMLIIGI